jgi:hypothetical protein
MGCFHFQRRVLRAPSRAETERRRRLHHADILLIVDAQTPPSLRSTAVIQLVTTNEQDNYMAIVVVGEYLN